MQVPGERLRPWSQVSHPYEIAKKAMHSIGYPSVKNEGIHTLRRSGARALFDSLKAQGEDQALLIVGSMLGHKDTKVIAATSGSRWRRATQSALHRRATVPRYAKNQGPQSHLVRHAGHIPPTVPK